MTPFQWIACSVLFTLVLLEAIRFLRTQGRRQRIVFRGIVYLLATVAILLPKLVSQSAHLVGIDRGADLVFYLLCLAFIMTSFFFYSCYSKLQNNVTELVRELAIRDAAQGSGKESN